MILSKLFVLGQEIELLWTDMDYHRKIRDNGKPLSEIMGGLITVCFPTGKDSDLILNWMSKESEDDTWEEVDKMEKGKVCFYEESFETSPIKTYEFTDAHLIYFKEVFDSVGTEPMQTIITISPAVQNYETELVKPWNVSWTAPIESKPHQPKEDEKKKKFVDYYITDVNGKRLEEYEVGDTIVLNIKTKNRINDKITIHLEDKSHDYKYQGKVLEDDKLKNYIINSDLEKVQLEVIIQSS
ncbi:type VI secretion system tube protein TssD [Aureivirga marina]|uniref:type VI secretion system tube protein TssD n=1 Tax=Aureivirga marina TaxID=1182451 RepID=UPI0018CBA993|nr:type VI secretion system tube protein TssD [Aureivirga marina]